MGRIWCRNLKYKNLNSLGKAYRKGEVNRSGYIRQRRDIIDAITNREVVASSATRESGDEREPTTIERAVEALNKTGEDEEGEPAQGHFMAVPHRAVGQNLRTSL